MKTIKEFIFTANFRHIYAVLTMLAFMILTTLPFWIGSTNLSQQAWSYLQNAQSAVIVLLTLAGRRYFDHKPLDNDTQDKPQSPISPIIGGNITNNSCPNPNCGLSAKS